MVEDVHVLLIRVALILLALAIFAIKRAIDEVRSAIDHLRFSVTKVLDERDDRGAVGAFGSVVLVAIVVTAGALAFASLEAGEAPGVAGVRADWVGVNVSGTEDRWDGHLLQVDGLIGDTDRADAVLMHNGTSYELDVYAGAEVWLPCPSSANPSSSLIVDGERVSWHANLPCHAQYGEDGGPPPSSSTEDPESTDSEIGDCERKVWVGGDEVASGPCLVGGST